MNEDVKVKDSIDESTVEGVRSLEADKYKYGFDSDIEQEFAPKGLNEDIVRYISEKKDEPQWLLDWRLEAYRRWLTLEEPEWAMVDYPKIDFQDMYYYASPVKKKELNSLDEVDPEILEIYKKLIESGGKIHLKTDDTQLFNYTLEILERRDDVQDLEYTWELYDSKYALDHHGVKTKYEHQFSEQGHKIKYLKFQFC